MNNVIYIIETRKENDFTLTAIHDGLAQAMAHAVELTVKAAERYGDPFECHAESSHAWMWDMYAVRMYAHTLGEATANPHSLLAQ